MAFALTCAFGLIAAPSAAAATSDRPSPSWYTQSLHEQVLAAGAPGVAVGEERLNTDCPGYAARGVSAAGCIVAPAGCTANFIFTDGASRYVGTAATASTASARRS